MVGRAYGMPTVALRFFNVYGTRQALSNPYTGVLAIFASRLLNGRPPLIFEDGRQRRDFVHVRDVARACRLALETPEAARRSVQRRQRRSAHGRGGGAAPSRARLGRPELQPQVTGKYRVGDIRHCFADIARARQRARLRAGGGLRRRAWPSSAAGSRARSRSTASTRRPPSWPAGGWWREPAEALGGAEGRTAALRS